MGYKKSNHKTRHHKKRNPKKKYHKRRFNKTKHYKTDGYNNNNNNNNSEFKKKNKFDGISEKSNKNLKEKKINKINFWDKITLRYKIFLGLLFLNILTYLIFSSLFNYVIILDIVFMIIWIWGWTNTCPRCKSHWARKLVDRSNFGSHTEFKHIRRNVTHRDSNGNVIGSSSVGDTRPVTLHTIQNHWTCKYCGHSWTGKVHDIER